MITLIKIITTTTITIMPITITKTIIEIITKTIIFVMLIKKQQSNVKVKRDNNK